MERDILSGRQMMVLLFTALLAPMVDLLPILSAWIAGKGGWLLPIGALLPVLASLWLGSRAFQGEKRNIHYILYIVYMLWTLFLLTLTARMAAARLGELYGDRPSFAFSVVVFVLAVWMGLGKTEALARAGEIFYLALAVVLGGVVLLAAFRVEPSNLSPPGVYAAELSVGSLAVAGIILNVYPAFILGRRVSGGGRNRKRAVGWTVAFCAAAALVTAAVIGCLGPRLTRSLSSPFIIMVQGLGIEGTFQRMEALVTSLWFLSDLMMACLLLHAWRALAAEVHRGKWGRRSLPAAAAVALVLGWLLFPEGDRVRAFCITVLPMTGLVFGLLCPAVFWIFRRKVTGGK